MINWLDSVYTVLAIFQPCNSGTCKENGGAHGNIASESQKKKDKHIAFICTIMCILEIKIKIDKK